MFVGVRKPGDARRVSFGRRNQLLTLAGNRAGGLETCSAKLMEKGPTRVRAKEEAYPERRNER